MTMNDDSQAPSPIEPSSAPGGGAGAGSRVAAGLAGCGLLFVGAIFTFGVAVSALLGVVLAWWIQRQRGRFLTRTGAWIAATSTATVLIMIGAALLFAMLPEGAFAEAMSAAQAAEPPPQPDWLERLAPADSATDRIVTSRPFTVYFGLLGASIAVLTIGSIAGTLGWAASLLVGFAVRGHWPMRRQ